MALDKDTDLEQWKRDGIRRVIMGELKADKPYPDPNLGTRTPNLGIVEYDPITDMYPEEIHHRVVFGMGCGSGIGKGWYDIVRELDEAITKIYPFYVVDQVKEKFGTLRYYIGSLPDDFPTAQYDKIYDLIHEAENKTDNICDVCGEYGERTVIGGYLLTTRCKKHDKKA